MLKKLFLLPLLLASLYAIEANQSEKSVDIPWGTLVEIANEMNTSELYNMSSEYIEEINTQENRDKLIKLYEDAKEKISFDATLANNKFCKNNAHIFANIKATNMKMQELEALYIGLCYKVESETLTSTQAQAILEERRKLLTEVSKRP